MLKLPIAALVLLLAAAAAAQTASGAGSGAQSNAAQSGRAQSGRAQTSGAQATGAQNSGNGTQSANTAPGADPSRANGATPSTQPLGANAAASGNGQGGATDQPSNAGNAAPAPVANGNVEIIGRPATTNRASQDRPLLPIASLGNSLGIRSGTPIRVHLKQSVDSGHARNGDMLDGSLSEPLGSIKAGTAVRLTVVQASKAGALLSFGELSLQVVAVGAHGLLSETISAQGQEGKKEQADAAPARGTEATFTADQTITLPAA